MKILIECEQFYPRLGGVQEHARLLGNEFVRLGHEVKLFTNTEGEDGSPDDRIDFSVLRKSKKKTRKQALTESDLVIHEFFRFRSFKHHLCAKGPKRLMVIHHRWISHGQAFRLLRKLIVEFFLTLRGKHFAVSSTLQADMLMLTTGLLANPYDADLFRIESNHQKTADLIFAGRFEKEKGLDLLLAALVCLRDRQVIPSLTLVGEGSQKVWMQNFITRNELSGQVRVHPPVNKTSLAKLLGAHRIFVLPSRWHEVAPISLLEAQACGLQLITAEGDSVAELLGRGSTHTFSMNNITQLCEAIVACLSNSQTLEQERRKALIMHTPAVIAARLLAFAFSN